MPVERVQLGLWEFDRALLDAAPLILPESWEGQPVVPLAPAEWAGMPQHGWRLVSDRADALRTWRHVVLAAPTAAVGALESPTAAAPPPVGPAASRAWWIAVMSWCGDHWKAATEPEPLLVRPDKATRRRELRLRWPSEALEVRRGETLHTVVHLTNEGSRDWYEPDDPLTVVTVILDATMLEPLPSERWRAYAPLRTPAAPLPVRGVIELPADIEAGAGQVPPGRHLVRASVLSLDLDSRPVPLTVV